MRQGLYNCRIEFCASSILFVELTCVNPQSGWNPGKGAPGFV
jgi:hypothetical protein